MNSPYKYHSIIFTLKQYRKRQATMQDVINSFHLLDVEEIGLFLATMLLSKGNYTVNEIDAIEKVYRNKLGLDKK